MIRRRALLFVCTTVLALLGTLLVYGQRTGKLTIFGDVATLPGLVSVSNDTDLSKGVSAGDGNTTVLTDEAGTWLTLVPGAKSGTAQFDVGHPDIVALQRFKPLPTPPQPVDTTITVQVAGSLDGIAYARLSEPESVETGVDTPAGLDLTSRLPEGSHFARIRLTLASNDPAGPPRFAGFGVNYELAVPTPTNQSSNGSGTVSADPVAEATVTVNSTLAGSSATAPPPPAPTGLAATGVGDWVILLMFLLAIGGALLLMSGRGFGGKR